MNKIDLSTAKPGDRFICRDKREATYLGVDPYENEFKYILAHQELLALSCNKDGKNLRNANINIIAHAPEKRRIKGKIYIWKSGSVEFVLEPAHPHRLDYETVISIDQEYTVGEEIEP